MANLLLKRDGNRAVLTFDRAESSANIFDLATLRELDACLAELAAHPPQGGLVIHSAKPSIFIAGADLKALSSAQGDELEELIQLGQSIFNRLEDLPVPTVAAIHGACAGGGYELCLACDWRIASDGKATKIGLPETQLGILPAWGGSTRLPKLIGLPRALEAILGGKLHAAKSALRRGMVDAVMPREVLLEQAWEFAARGKRREPRHFWLHLMPVRDFISAKSRRMLMEKTRGNYPGALKALEVVGKALDRPREESLKNECEAILELSALPQTKNLMRLFFLSDRAKKHQPVQASARKIGAVAVIGAGVMGAGIAYWLASRGHRVMLQDIDDGALARGMKTIEGFAGQAVKKRVITKLAARDAIDRIVPVKGGVSLKHCDLVIEAAVERLEIKKKVFADLALRTRPDCLLATNTSALPIHELAPVVGDPARLLGLHFFNPAHRMPLVEVVRTDATSNETIATAFGFVRGIGKTPVLVRDRPGFLVNRILLPYLVEAGDLFAAGADPVAMDRAMLDFGMPMGPLRLLDEVGLDVALHVARTLAAAFPDRMTVPPLIEAMVAKQMLGRKNGVGFYRYDGRKESPNPDALALRHGHERLPERLAERLAGMMSDEAQRCLDERVAENAEDVDLAMILGTGYPPFRGGPLRHREQPIPL